MVEEGETADRDIVGGRGWCSEYKLHPSAGLEFEVRRDLSRS